MIREIKKSIRHTRIELKGITILGKNTLENKLELATIELLTSLNKLANNCHSNMDEATNKKFEAGSIELFILLAKYPNTKIFINGLMIAQITPAKACL